MQTFLPYADFEQTAKCLDVKRLGKQRVEAWQIYLSLTVVEYGWKNHPAVKMWKNYELALMFYGLAICHQWRQLSYKDTMFTKFEEVANFNFKNGLTQVVMPPWIGWKEFHDSHKSNLVRKMPDHYQKLWPDLDGARPYIWPSKDQRYLF